MTISHKQWLEDKIRERCHENDDYCECDYPYHSKHRNGCPEKIRKGHFRPAHGYYLKRIRTLRNTILVCPQCAKEISASFHR
jgi:hypothetical protein